MSGLHSDYDYNEQSFSDFSTDNDSNALKRKRIRRQLEEKLERKRLKIECSDDFDEFSSDFDWDEIWK